MLERTKSAERVDQDAPWQLAHSDTRRIEGRYRVEAVFAHDGYIRIVKFWLRGDADVNRDHFLACREITNSRRDPAEFEGQELPTKGTEA
jgi:hypothetical protein